MFGRQGDEASFEYFSEQPTEEQERTFHPLLSGLISCVFIPRRRYLSGSNQPWPFVAGADHELLLKGRRSHLELMDYIGFEADWVASKIAGGTAFRMVLFALA